MWRKMFVYFYFVWIDKSIWDNKIDFLLHKSNHSKPYSFFIVIFTKFEKLFGKYE